MKSTYLGNVLDHLKEFYTRTGIDQVDIKRTTEICTNIQSI